MNVERDDKGQLRPTGDCWCGCGAGTRDGRFFAMGHDRRAEAAVIEAVYGSVPEFLVASGFGPGGRNAMRERDEKKGDRN